MLRVTAIDLVAGIIEQLEEEPAEHGRPRLPATEVVATLQFFLREGVQWRELFAGTGRASGSTLRRRLREWRNAALLPRVHAVVLRMARSGPEAAARAPDIVVDSCSVRAKQRGELTGRTPPTAASAAPSTTSWSRPTACRGAPWPRPRTSMTP